jgi:hypothetical protein
MSKFDSTLHNKFLTSITEELKPCILTTESFRNLELQLNELNLLPRSISKYKIYELL